MFLFFFFFFENIVPSLDNLIGKNHSKTIDVYTHTAITVNKFWAGQALSPNFYWNVLWSKFFYDIYGRKIVAKLPISIHPKGWTAFTQAYAQFVR